MATIPEESAKVLSTSMAVDSDNRFVLNFTDAENSSAGSPTSSQSPTRKRAHVGLSAGPSSKVVDLFRVNCFLIPVLRLRVLRPFLPFRLCLRLAFLGSLHPYIGFCATFEHRKTIDQACSVAVCPVRRHLCSTFRPWFSFIGLWFRLRQSQPPALGLCVTPWKCHGSVASVSTLRYKRGAFFVSLEEKR